MADIPLGMTEEEYDRRMRFQKLDHKVFEIFCHNDDAYDFYQEFLREIFQSTIKARVKYCEETIVRKDMQIDALKKENNLIWKKYVDDIAEEKLKNRSIGPVTLVPSNIK